MRVIIIEDEPKNIKILKTFLGEIHSVEIVGEASSIQQAKAVYHNLKPDLLLLDIQLLNGTAFDLLDEIMPVSCEIIFITAYDSFAIKAFKYSAIDYLLKPVNIDELKLAIKNAEGKIKEKTMNVRLQQLIDTLSRTHVNRIALSVDSEIVFINTDEIMYCRARGSETIVSTSSAKTLTSTQPIGHLEEILKNEDFFRIHNSYLVNLKYIAKYVKGRGGIVVMQDGTKIEVATRRKEEFLLSIRKFGHTY